MTMARYVRVLLSTLQIFIPPFLISHLSLTALTWPFYLYVVVAFLVASAEAFQQPKILWLAAALGLAVGFGQPMLIPLLLTQIFLTSLLITQQLAQPIHETLWLVVVFFLQLVGATTLTQGLTPMLIWALGLSALLNLVVLWVNRLTLPVAGILIIALLVSGYLTQQIGLLTGAALLAVTAITQIPFISQWKLRGRLSNLLCNIMIYLGTLQG